MVHPIVVGANILKDVVIQALMKEEEIINDTIKMIAMTIKVSSFKEEEKMAVIKEAKPRT